MPSIANYQLKVKNLGPIKDGYPDSTEDGFISLSKLNVFIGEQGSGKSTIAKIMSTLLWLEKAFVRKEQDAKSFKAEDFINLCRNQRIDSFFSKDTYIHFKSEIYNFEYKNSVLKVNERKKTDEYYSKKIMYIPSERNFISIVEDAESRTGLPYTLLNTLDEFKNASKTLGQKKLPLNGYEYFFDKGINTSFIYEQNSDSTVKLSEASSGLQSFVPLFIISNYLANNVTHDFFENLKNFSLSDRKRAEETIYSYFTERYRDKADALIKKLNLFYRSGLDNVFTDTDKKTILSSLRSILNVCFYNIVEEPEQNLFPSSQIKVIESLIKDLNTNARNSLIITTHSPFILSAINNILYASKINEQSTESIISKDLWIQKNECCPYLIKDGKIYNIMDEDLGIIDTEVIDDCANEYNNLLETHYLLSNKANADHLVKSIQQLNAGKTHLSEIIENE